jgi:hypothetical protein
MDKDKAARKYRLLQAAALLAMFRRAHHGREPIDVEEVGEWASAQKLRKIDPFTDLTPVELAAIKRESPDLFE